MRTTSRAAARRERRQRDWEVLRNAALREEGRRHRGLILYGPFFARAGGLLLLAAGAAWCWLYVPHTRIAAAAAAVGVLCLITFAGHTAATSGTQARLMARAAGRESSGAWPYVAAAGVLLLVAASYLYRTAG